MKTRTLDLDAVHTFTLICTLGSFTRVANEIGTTQSAVSLKLKRLERFLGKRLVERTPRSVRITEEGLAFLGHARELLAANDRALFAHAEPKQRLSLGISDHACGAELPRLLSKIHTADRNLTIDVSVGFSQNLLRSFDNGKFDAVIVRQEAGRRGGQILCIDDFDWFAAADYIQVPNEPLRLANLSAPCGVRAVAIRALDRAKVPWVETFVGGGVAAVVAAAESSLAVTALAKRIAPANLVCVGSKFRLPTLFRSKVMLYANVTEPRTRSALRILSTAFRGHN